MNERENLLSRLESAIKGTYDDFDEIRDLFTEVLDSKLDVSIGMSREEVKKELDIKSFRTSSISAKLLNIPTILKVIDKIYDSIQKNVVDKCTDCKYSAEDYTIDTQSFTECKNPKSLLYCTSLSDTLYEDSDNYNQKRSVFGSWLKLSEYSCDAVLVSYDEDSRVDAKAIQ